MQTVTPELEAILKAFFQAGASGFAARVEVDHVDLAADPPTIDTVSYGVDRLDINKSLRLEADEAEIGIPRDAVAPLGWGIDSVFQKYSRFRVFQWYGDPANEVQTFTGLIDLSDDTRDPIRITLTGRDLMALLIDYTFSASAPQGAGETGAVRTEANGVFLSRELSYIVGRILDIAGWPAADRAITPTSFVVDEFIWQDGASANEAITGDSQLTGLVGYVAWADEFGVFHFAPSLATSSLTAPPTADYIFRPGEDLMSLADSVDTYDLRTRVKARGPLTTQVLTDEWRELWRTSKFSKPVGLWHDPSAAGNLRVIDRGTKHLYNMRQSDRVVLSSIDISTICPHPLGLSGDPADSSVYWILNAPWIDGGSGGNRAKKVRKSDNVVIASFALPDGEISALKVSSSYLYFTRLDTDRFYRASKTTGAVIASYQHAYNAVVQANPSGMMIDGTTLHLFWANGGTTARFLICEESAPTVITKVVKTAGTTLHGGEMDTVTHTHCYGDSDSLGLVAKFSLVAVSDRTAEVYAEVVDTDLEDELGALAQVEDREHDTHPGDPDHQWFARRDTVDLAVITSLAQATETALRRLEILSRPREVLDAGIIGNPAIQKTDVFGVVDPVTGLNALYRLDAYRSTMDAGGTYVGTIAGITIPDLVAENGDIEDGGEGTVDPPPVIVDLNFLHGTDTDGGSTAGLEFHTPSNANDSDIVADIGTLGDSNTFSDSGVHSDGDTISRRLKADLGADFAVSTMTVWSENFDGGDPSLTVEYGDDGVTWTPVTGYVYANTLFSGEINRQDIEFDAVTARWWRITSSFVGSGLGFFTDMHVWTWAIWSGAVAEGGSDGEEDGGGSGGGGSVGEGGGGVTGMLRAFYISQSTGSDSTGDGSIFDPWATLEKFLASGPLPGDTLLPRGGRYTGTGNRQQLISNVSGTAAHPISVVGYAGETAIFDGEANGSTDIDRFFIEHYPGCNYWTWQGLTLVNFAMLQNGIITAAGLSGQLCTNLKFRKLKIQQRAPADPSAQVIYVGEYVNTVLMEGCLVEGAYPGSGVTGGAAFSAYADTGPSPTGLIVRYNAIKGMFTGIQAYSEGVELEAVHNTLIGCRDNFDLTHHATILIRDNAGTTGSDADIYDPDPTGSTKDHNFFGQAFGPGPDYQLVAGSGIGAASDGGDAGWQGGVA